MTRKLDIYHGLTIADSAKPAPGLTDEKPLGLYLVEAGLLTPAQVEVALNDQKITGLRFGQVLVVRGWVKQQTIDYLMRKIIIPEREAYRRQLRQVAYVQATAVRTTSEEITVPFIESDTPQQLPPASEPDFTGSRAAIAPNNIGSDEEDSDDEISWVG